MSKYTILLYHGVYDNDCDLGLFNRSGKHISAQRFRDQMRDLAENHPVVSFSDIVLAHRGRREIPDNAVVVSFDDGFLNNYEVAWPILSEFQIPAIIYLATGFIGTGKSVWSDRLEKALLSENRLDFIPADIGLPKTYALKEPEQKIAAFLELKEHCKNLPNEQKDRLVSAVEDFCNVSVSDRHPLFAFMGWDQVREMNLSPLITFGAHTVDHVSLGKVSNQIMRQQISHSVQKLEAEIGEKVDYFSYPEGMERDFTPEVIEYLKSLGFDHCPTAMFGTNDTRFTNPFWLKRIMVGFEDQSYPFADL